MSNHNIHPGHLADKTLAELRELITQLPGKCLDCDTYPSCMIRKLSGLTHCSLNTVVDTLPRETCLEILAEHFSCPECGVGCKSSHGLFGV